MSFFRRPRRLVAIDETRCGICTHGRQAGCHYPVVGTRSPKECQCPGFKPVVLKVVEQELVPKSGEEWKLR